MRRQRLGWRLAPRRRRWRWGQVPGRGRRRAGAALRRRRREVFGRRQEHQLVRLWLLPGRGRRGRRGRRRLWSLRLWSLRLGRLRLWSFGLGRLRLWFGLLGLGPKRSLGDRIVGPVVLPCYKRALLAPGSERFFAQELVKRQHRRGPGLVRAGPKEPGDGLAVGVAPQHEGDLPRLREVVLVRLDVVSRHRDRQRRMRVVPADQVTFLFFRLRHDPLPDAGDDVGGPVAVNRLAQAQRRVDDEIRNVGVGTLAQITDEEAQDPLPRRRGGGEVLADGREGGLREEHGERDVARPRASSSPSPRPRRGSGTPQDGLGERDRLAERSVRAHRSKIMSGCLTPYGRRRRSARASRRGRASAGIRSAVGSSRGRAAAVPCPRTRSRRRLRTRGR